MKVPYIIAEIGLHAEGDLQRAKQYIWEAANAGANAAKFQAVFPERIVSARAPTYFHQEGEQAQTQREFFARAPAFTLHDYEELAAYCKYVGIDFLCTPFDVETVEWLNPLVPAFKIASADIVNVPLLEAVARTGKPVYLSTGAATWTEMLLARRTLYDHGAPSVIIMHCVLCYPTVTNDANLGMIHDCEMTGYSDHTLFNLDVLTTAWLLGATVIEKHFTLDKTLPGNDHYHSMDPTDLRALVAKLKELQAMIGDGEKRVLPCEEAARLNARQSWHAARDLPAGHVIADGDVLLKRPADGLPPDRSPVGLVTKHPVNGDLPITDTDVHAVRWDPRLPAWIEVA